MAAYPNVSAEMPGVELKEEKNNFQVVSDDPEPDFAALVAAALDNAGILTLKTDSVPLNNYNRQQIQLHPQDPP